MSFDGAACALFLAGLVVWQASRWLYLVYFHPLAGYPGPALARLTNFWCAQKGSGECWEPQLTGRCRRFASFLKGQQHLVDQDLHNRYGRFVRDGPDSLLVADIDAFRSIYSFSGKLEKGDFYTLATNGTPDQPNIFAARTEAQHRRIRKKLVSTAVNVAPSTVSTVSPYLMFHLLSSSRQRTLPNMNLPS
jgi:benzoate 4-monooxygenase